MTKVRLNALGNDDVLKTLSKLNPVLNYTFPIQTQEYLQTYANGGDINSLVTKANQLYTDLANVLAKDVMLNSFIAEELPFINVVSGENYGDVIRHMHVGIAKIMPFNPENERHYEPNPFIRVEDDVKALYHRERTKTFSEQTITHDETVKAFTDAKGVGQLMANKLASMEDAYRLYINYMRKALLKMAEDNYAYVKATVPTDQKSGETFIKEVIDLVAKMQRPNRDYNAANVIQSVNPSDMVLLLDDKYKSIITVDILSKAFNKEQLELPYRIEWTDTFGLNKKAHTVEGEFEMEVGTIKNAVALLVHKDFFKIEQIYNAHEFIKNPKGRYSNHYLHRDFRTYFVWFLPAVALVTEVPERKPESYWAKQREKDEATKVAQSED